MVVDAHVHVIVPEMLRARGRSQGWRPRVRREGATCVVEFEGREIRSMVDEVVDVDTILASLAGNGVDRVILAPWVPLLFPTADADVALERCRIQNEALAGIVATHPDRVSALGVVPMQAPELAADEISRICGDGLAGVEVTASTRGVYLGDPAYGPFWQAAEDHEAFVFIHPTTRGFDLPAFLDHYLWNTVGNPLETTIAAAQMTMAGVLERHQRLRVLLAHGGGALLALRGRLAHSHRFQSAARSSLSESPLESVRRFHFDTLTHDQGLLRELIAFVGADRVLLGSDYPFDMGDRDGVRVIRSLGLSAQDELGVLGHNAARLLGLDPIASPASRAD